MHSEVSKYILRSESAFRGQQVHSEVNMGQQVNFEVSKSILRSARAVPADNHL